MPLFILYEDDTAVFSDHSPTFEPGYRALAEGPHGRHFEQHAPAPLRKAWELNVLFLGVYFKEWMKNNCPWLRDAKNQSWALDKLWIIANWCVVVLLTVIIDLLLRVPATALGCFRDPMSTAGYHFGIFLTVVGCVFSASDIAERRFKALQVKMLQEYYKPLAHRCVCLTRDEVNGITQSLLLLKDCSGFYNMTPGWTDQTANIIYLNLPSLKKRIGVSGNLNAEGGIELSLPSSRPDGPQEAPPLLPPELVSAINRLRTFKHSKSELWQPEFFEVYLQPYTAAKPSSLVRWPAELPGLNDKMTVDHGTSYVFEKSPPDNRNSFSLFVPSSLLPILKKVAKEGKAFDCSVIGDAPGRFELRRPVCIGKKKFQMWLKPHFPGQHTLRELVQGKPIK